MNKDEPKTKLFTDYGVLELTEREKQEAIKWYKDYYDSLKTWRRVEVEQGVKGHYVR